MQYLRRTSTFLGAAIGIAVFILGLITYSVGSTDMETGEKRDGLGRLLLEPPIFMPERWTGWDWFVVDAVTFLVASFLREHLSSLV